MLNMEGEGIEGIDRTDDLVFEPIKAEEEDYYSGPVEYDLNVYPADFTLEVLYKKWKSGKIVIPEFQRKFVWKQIQSSKLIESFMLGLPVPAIYLYTDRKTGNQLVVKTQGDSSFVSSGF